MANIQLDGFEPTPVDKFRYLITCPCGLTRALPADTKAGDKINLISCIRCGATLIGTFTGEGVEAY